MSILGRLKGAGSLTANMARAKYALAAGAAIFALAGAQAAQAYEAYVNTPAPILTGPSPEYPPVVNLYGGEQVEVYGCLDDYDWCDVSFRDYRGWMDAEQLSYPYEGRRVPLYDYGYYIGLPVLSFSLNDYWGRYYRNRPFFRERERWARIAPPRPRGDDHRRFEGRPGFGGDRRPDFDRGGPGRPDFDRDRGQGRPDFNRGDQGRPDFNRGEGRPDQGRPDFNRGQQFQQQRGQEQQRAQEQQRNAQEQQQRIQQQQRGAQEQQQRGAQEQQRAQQMQQMQQQRAAQEQQRAQQVQQQQQQPHMQGTGEHQRYVGPGQPPRPQGAPQGAPQAPPQARPEGDRPGGGRGDRPQQQDNK